MTSPGSGDAFKKVAQDKPNARDVRDFHTNSDVDTSSLAQHHTLGTTKNTAAEGAHEHDGRTSKQISLSNVIKNPLTVTGSKGGNAALASLLTQLHAMGIIVDNST